MTKCLICNGRKVDRMGRPCLNCGGTGETQSARVSHLAINHALTLFGISELPPSEDDVKRYRNNALRAAHPDANPGKPFAVKFDAAEYARAWATLVAAIRERNGT